MLRDGIDDMFELVLIISVAIALAALVLVLLRLNRRLVRARAAVEALNEKLESYARKRLCMYRISSVSLNKQGSIGDILEEVVNIIPSCCKHSELLCAKIKMEGVEYSTANFRETACGANAVVAYSGKIFGLVSIYYQGEIPAETLQQVKLVLDELAENLGGIIEHKRAEEALRKNESRLKIAQRIGCMGDWELDFTASKLHWSDEVYRIFEVDPDIFTPSYEYFLQLVHPDDRDEVNNAFLQSLSNRVPYHIEHRLLMKDGRIKYLREQCESEFDWAGKPLISRGTVQDITDLWRFDESQRIALVAFESQESMMITNADGVILRVNKAFTRDTGYLPEEVVGLTPRLLQSGKHGSEFYESLWNSVHRTGTWQGEIFDKNKVGEIKLKFLTIAAVKNAQGQTTHYVGSYLDITEYKAAEEEVAKVRKLLQRGLLIREVHHRIKNNLQGVTGILRLKAEANPALAESIQHVISQVNSISMIHGLQGCSNMSEVDFCDLVTAIAVESGKLWNTEIKMEMPSRNNAYRVAESEAVPIALVLNELIANALKHGRDRNVHICVASSKRNLEGMLLSIRNSGKIAEDFSWNSKDYFGTGLQLVASLLPQDGVELSWEQEEEAVITSLEVSSPVVRREAREN